LDRRCDVEACDQWDTEMSGHVELARSRWDTASFPTLTAISKLLKISNLSLLKYFIQKIYGKRDISQQVVTLSKFGNARIYDLKPKKI
jgi:hypothetical protein